MSEDVQYVQLLISVKLAWIMKPLVLKGNAWLASSLIVEYAQQTWLVLLVWKDINSIIERLNVWLVILQVVMSAHRITLVTNVCQGSLLSIINVLSVHIHVLNVIQMGFVWIVWLLSFLNSQIMTINAIDAQFKIV